MGVRLYNPGTGRFLSADPICGGNANAYTFPLNPVDGYDLGGMQYDSGGFNPSSAGDDNDTGYGYPDACSPDEPKAFQNRANKHKSKGKSKGKSNMDSSRGPGELFIFASRRSRFPTSRSHFSAGSGRGIICSMEPGFLLL